MTKSSKEKKVEVAPAADSPFRVLNAEFLFGVPSVSKIPPQPLSEIAVIGRSNVGKSSFVNRLVGRKIARVSSTPGCTQELNFFCIRGELNEEVGDLCLVDLPGFGYAKLSKSERERISKEVVKYIRTRKQLQLVLLLNDSKRSPEVDEYAIQKICAESELPCLVVATKIDRLNQKEKGKLLPSMAHAFGLFKEDLILAGEKLSVAPVWERVLAVL